MTGEWQAERDWPLLTQGLAGRLRQDCMKQWLDFVGHPFVEGVASGTMEVEAFRNFLIQDYLYLIQYARACALLVHKSDTLTAMRHAAQLLSGILDTELSMHVGYCRQWGIEEPALEQAEESIELLAYSRFILDRAQTGDMLDLLVTLAPCLIGYAEVGARLHASPRTVREGNPYWSWIALYGGDEYTALVEDGVCRLNEVGAAYGAQARYPTLLREFTTAVRLETVFWTTARSG
ncbi:thiaminase II [Komagataeibacter diospyri]|uniref:Aminopyrimidine aminohydrolase n=1 Tax=Komagataeibacter diospyri TaxID=1932662 RepID=A0A4P5NXW5_9PROT|nr:thiaminase II [Komagataeibacter diospyri]GCE84771.1 transcriptional activator TenA family [Komagataeibacter diospyri]GCE91643.1 transcriptional activator TenA family [Komagataeibacter diospyri]